METEIIFFVRERFRWSGGDANQLFLFIWPNIANLEKLFDQFFKVCSQERRKRKHGRRRSSNKKKSVT